MDERRDLVDREELRRRLGSLGFVAGIAALDVLDAMPSVTVPKGWTRDEVLAELAKHPDNVCEGQNIYTGEWVALARELIDQWRPEVSRFDVRVVRSTPDPEWVPLTKLVGRTIHGCDCASGVVDRDPSALSGEGWRWYDGREWHPFPEGTLNLETGQVAVRPKAAT